MEVENFIFESYKNKPLKNARTFKSEVKQKFKNINPDNIYVKVMNYQINKYGNALSTYDSVPNKEEAHRISTNRNSRRYKRKKK